MLRSTVYRGFKSRTNWTLGLYSSKNGSKIFVIFIFAAKILWNCLYQNDLLSSLRTLESFEANEVWSKSSGRFVYQLDSSHIFITWTGRYFGIFTIFPSRKVYRTSNLFFWDQRFLGRKMIQSIILTLLYPTFKMCNVDIFMRKVEVGVQRLIIQN